MKLIYLHGPPAAGKYTIAKALETKIGARIFHNHLTIDVAKAIFDFGTPAFWIWSMRCGCTVLRLPRSRLKVWLSTQAVTPTPIICPFWKRLKMLCCQPAPSCCRSFYSLM